MTQEDKAISRYLTVEEVAERLKVSVSWVYRHKDLLGAVRLGAAAALDRALLGQRAAWSNRCQRSAAACRPGSGPGSARADAGRMAGLPRSRPCTMPPCRRSPDDL